jgi:DNA-binding CsgD family transcriptional regulator
MALNCGRAMEPLAEAELLEQLATECYLTDHLQEAIAASDRAMQLRQRSGDASGCSYNHHALSVYQWYNADRSAAERHAAQAVAALECGPATSGDPTPADGPSVELARLGHAYAMQAYLALQSTELDAARTFVGRAAQFEETADEPTLSARLELIREICRVVEGDEPARERLRAILASATDHLDEVYSMGYSNLSYLDVEQRRFGPAAELLGVSIPLTVERDLPICRAWQVGSRGRLRLLQGDWDGALEDATAVLSGPTAPLACTWPHLVRGLVTLRRGGDADADLEEAWRLACCYGEPIRLLPAAAALAERAWLANGVDARFDAWRELLEQSPRVGLEWARGELACWLHRLDPDVDADDVAPPYRCQLDGDLEQAAAWWADLAAPYERALALIDGGQAEEVRAGLDGLDRLAADGVAAKVRRELRSSGLKVVPARRREATRANPAGLTARQVEVVRLLRDGLSNAELADQLYISTKTVDHHVSAVLSKLGVTSRREAVRAARQLGIID